MNLPYAMQLRGKIQTCLDESQFYILMGELILQEITSYEDSISDVNVNYVISLKRRHKEIMKLSDRACKRAMKLNKKYVRLMRKTDGQSE